MAGRRARVRLARCAGRAKPARRSVPLIYRCPWRGGSRLAAAPREAFTMPDVFLDAVIRARLTQGWRERTGQSRADHAREIRFAVGLGKQQHIRIEPSVMQNRVLRVA